MLRRSGLLLAGLACVLAAVAPPPALAAETPAVVPPPAGARPAAPPTAGEPLALVGGTLVNPGKPPIPVAAIYIRDGRVVAAGAANDVGPIPPGFRYVETTGKYIVPGYVDGHVHFFQSGGLYTRPDAIDLRGVRPYADEIAALRADLPETFRRYLASGVTAVADVGGPFWNFDVRDLAAASDAAPRVAVAGPLVSTYQPAELTTDDPPILRVATAEDARALVRRQLARRPDFVKIWYIVREGETPEQHLPIVRAAIDEAHAAGVRVAVHATELATARAAVAAGADVLVHSVDDASVDDAFVALLRERGTIYIPTLMVVERYLRVFRREVELTAAEWRLADPDVAGTWFDLAHLPPPADAPPWFAKPEILPPAAAPSVALANLKRLHDAGVTIALGTDAGNIGTPHGPSVFREAELMREAGLTPGEVLAAMTLGGARLLGRERELGTLEAGYLADLVVLYDDPLADVANLAGIDRVVKGGVSYLPHDVLVESPAQVVQRQVNAYNARDLEAFVATYADDAAGSMFPGSPLFAGHPGLRETYGSFFESSPQLHCEIVDRMVSGNFVIDHERVTGADATPIDGVALYEVGDGVIRNVWFLPAAPPAESP